MSGDDISGLARRWGQRTRTHRREEDSEEQLEAMTPAMIYPLGAHLRVVTLSQYLQIVTTLRAAVTVTVGTLHITAFARCLQQAQRFRQCSSVFFCFIVLTTRAA